MKADEKFAWVTRSRTLLIDAYWPPLAPNLDFDAAQLAEAVKTLHADTVRFGTAGKYGLLPSRVMPPHPQLAGRNLLAEAIEACRELDTRMIAYVPVSHGLPRSLLERDRPGWALRLDDGSLPAGVQHFGGEPLAPTCPFGPYRADILAFIREVVEGHELAGLYLDGPYHNWSMGGPLAVCQCPACRESYRRDTGEELPTNREVGGEKSPELDRRVARYRDWVAQGLLDLLREIKGLARQNGAELPVIFNAFAASARPPAYEKQILDTADGFLLESELAGLKGLGTGRHLGKLIWRYTQPHDGWPRLSTPRREAANLQAALETLAWGGAPIVSYAGRFLLDRRQAAPLAGLFGLLEKHAGIMADTMPVKHIGLICLARPMGHDAKFQPALSGAYLALQSQGVQTGVVPRAALAEPDGLDGWTGLVLPTAAGLTPEETAALQAYVKRGGGLTVLAPGEGTLAEWLGLTPLAESPIDRRALRYWAGEWDVYLPEPEDSGRDFLPLKGLRQNAKGSTEPLAWAVAGADNAQLAPALVRRQTGRANLALFPLAELYHETREPGLAAWIARLAQETAAAPQPHRLPGADAWIHSALHEKPGLRLLWIYDTSPTERSVKFNVTFALPAGARDVRLISLRHDRPVGGERDGENWLARNVELAGYDCLALSYA